MASIRDYHRPGTVDDALALLNRADANSVLLGGGTSVVPQPGEEPVEVIDLQSLPLDGISSEADGRIRLGATARLRDVVDAGAMPELIRTAAKREAPNTIRNAATIGGTVASADWESGLVAALLVHEAEVVLIGETGSSTVPLPDLLADRSRLSRHIISAVNVAGDGVTAWAATGRTPADTPIVSAFARRNGEATRLALTGVAGTPVLVDPGDVAGLDPPGDFRGSAEYRRSLAAALASRVVAAVEGRS